MMCRDQSSNGLHLSTSNFLDMSKISAAARGRGTAGLLSAGQPCSDGLEPSHDLLEPRPLGSVLLPPLSDDLLHPRRRCRPGRDSVVSGTRARARDECTSRPCDSRVGSDKCGFTPLAGGLGRTPSLTRPRMMPMASSCPSWKMLWARAHGGVAGVSTGPIQDFSNQATASVPASGPS
jgi:hypothetical protein